MIVSVAFGIAGAVGLLMLLSRTGLVSVLDGIGAVGWSGFLLLLGGQLLLILPLALATRSICPSAPLSAMLRARLVRDAATSCLPFTSIGGLAFGMRALVASGMGWQLAVVVTAADVTMEFVGQIAFMLGGLVLLLVHGFQANSTFPFICVAMIAAGAAVTMLLIQRRLPDILRRLADRMGIERLRPANATINSLGDAIQRVHGRPIRLVAAACFHLLAWTGSGVLTWATYRLLGTPLSLGSALVIEAWVSFARMAAFMVPGALGVQEAVYIGLGGAFGIVANASLSVSLLRRARDLAIGVPILLGWQLAEAHFARRRRLIAGLSSQ